MTVAAAPVTRRSAGAEGRPGAQGRTKDVAVLGGGILGLTIAYRLARAGHSVTVHEASPYLGGLASAVEIAGSRVDRYYHVILASDEHLMRLFEELELQDHMRWGTTKMAFFHEGRLFPMSTASEFFRFPPLSMLDRLRLARTLATAKFTRDWRSLDNVSLEEWLTRLSGKRTYENVWRPLLASKFDGAADRVPATYIWSRIRRMTSTRQGVRQKEAMGHLAGGYETLAIALAQRLEQMGGSVLQNSRVEKIALENGAARGLVIDGQLQSYDAVVATAADPILARLLPDAPPAMQTELAGAKYLGIASLLLLLDRPLSPYYSVNLTDRSIPLTGIIETTTLIDPESVGGHLVYLPKYCKQESAYLTMDEDDVRDEFLGHLESVFPEFDRSWIKGSLLGRSRLVEPIHEIAETRDLPGASTPVPGLFISNTRRIYPALHNCEAVVGLAERAVPEVLETLDA